ncbi:MAG TPA: DUF488 domain-containing protein [Methylomirabilota bacterium]|jgi:uncharacterized protein (DUF488 family)|nr:DUF488 domain-containing protein [Methylomirabilota bacterium]
MTVYSIGFTRKTAEQFFGALRGVGIKRLLDVRLHTASTLAGFTRGDHLPFLLRELCGAGYEREPMLAPSEELFRAIKARRIGWPEYETAFLQLMAQRRVEDRISRAGFRVPTVLLCSEPAADRCHRRLVLEYLNEKWSQALEVVHL